MPQLNQTITIFGCTILGNYTSTENGPLVLKPVFAIQIGANNTNSGLQDRRLYHQQTLYRQHRLFTL